MTCLAYEPHPVHVVAGQTVKWTNKNDSFHTVTSGMPGDLDAGEEFDSGLSGSTALTNKGKIFEHVFEKEGDYFYFCTLHPEMV